MAGPYQVFIKTAFDISSVSRLISKKEDKYLKRIDKINTRNYKQDAEIHNIDSIINREDRKGIRACWFDQK